MGLAWFPCYVNDLLGSIRWKMMTTEERGAYWQLICYQMQSNCGRLASDLLELSALADLDLTQGHQIVVEAFPPHPDGGRANVRALQEWEKRHRLSQIRREVGAKGGRNSDGNSTRNCDSNSEAIAHTTTTTTTSRETTTPTARKKHTREPYRWEDFAAIYPPHRLNYTKQAKTWWLQNAKTDATVDQILDGVRRWAQSQQWQDGAVPNCGKFLSGEVWKSPAPPRARSRQEALEENNRRVTEQYIASLGIEK